ncbi:Hypothetical protein CINCED_3A006661 [Cinara cedri]|uniref:Uncharacterized protein n=1 Tax=Cinara cedri TaxID=506608 RepID=A0A5E4N836_9HEMI|nr:Hypothetical protein CINCED_3A006661 [Cinara cedri]
MDNTREFITLLQNDCKTEYFSDFNEDTDADDDTMTRDEDDFEYCCTDKCLSTFDDEFKSRLKSDLSQLSASEKHIYLFAMISISKEKKSCTKPKSNFQFNYTVKEYGITRYVCKSAFMSLHDTTHAHVRTLCKKMSENNLIPKDKRGRHEKQPTISEDMKEQVKSHFFKILETPTIFKCAKKAFGEPNITKLWLDFKKNHGHIARSTYSKYIRQCITTETLTKFMCANEARNILNQMNKF